MAVMQNEQQFQQLILQYKQLINGAKDIALMIQQEDFDNAITMVKTREQIFLNCKCMRNFLELTPEQQKEVDSLVEELKTLESENIQQLQKNMEDVQAELSKVQLSHKLQKAYSTNSYNSSGNMINFQE